MKDPCSIPTCVSPQAVWWYRLFKWLVLGLMVLLLASLLGLRSLTRPELVSVPRAPIPSLSVIGLQLGDLTLAGSDGHVTGPIDVAGLGLFGAIVQIQRDGTLVGEVEVDELGDWSFHEVVRLLPGRYRFDFRMLGKDRAAIGQSVRFEMIIPKIALPQPPSVALVGVEQYPLVIVGVNKDRDGNPSKGFFGRGRPNSSLEIVWGGTVLGEVSVQEDGSWRCECVLPPGAHTLVVREVENPKRVSEPMVLTIANPAPPVVLPEVKPDPDRPRVFCPDPLPTGEIRGNLYAIAECETLGRIARRLLTDVPTLLAYNPQVPNPNRIYAGQLLNIPATASCSNVN